MNDTEQNILKEKIIKKVIESFDTSERKAKDCNVMMERFKSNYSLSEMEHCAEDTFNKAIQLAQKENQNQLPTSSNKDTGENNQVADEWGKLNQEKGRLYSSSIESSSAEKQVKVSPVGSNNIEKYKKETAEKVEKLKEELIKSWGREHCEYLLTIIDKIFKDNTKKEAEK